MTMIPVDSDVPMNDLEEGEYRVVSTEPVSGEHGDVEVVALYRRYKGGNGKVETHRFTFMYHYLADDGGCQIGLGEWVPEGGTV